MITPVEAKILRHTNSSLSKYPIVYDTIEQVETSGGIQTEAQAQTILINLLKGLGL